MKLRIFFDLETVEQVAAFLSVAETLNVHMQMAPMVDSRGKWARRRERMATLLKVGEKPDRLTPKSARLWAMAVKALSKGPLTVTELVGKMAKNARIDHKHVGYYVASWQRVGALVPDPTTEPTKSGDEPEVTAG